MKALLTLLSLLCLAHTSLAQLKIAGEVKYPPHSLVKLRAEGVSEKVGLRWRVSPGKGVQRATNPRGVFEFCAPPGTYEVELLVVTATADGVNLEEAYATVTIGEAKPDPPPQKSDAVQATVRLQFGSSGCTATIIGPRRADGKWDVITAAHCTGGINARGSITLKDGRRFSVKVISRNRDADLCWMVTEEAVESLPCAMLAPSNPEPGSKVWHKGYGIDEPQSLETGLVQRSENSQGQLQIYLSVSPGDSGSGIFREDSNELVAVVCCTSALAREASMWGGSVEMALKMRPKVVGEQTTSEERLYPVLRYPILEIPG